MKYVTLRCQSSTRDFSLDLIKGSELTHLINSDAKRIPKIKENWLISYQSKLAKKTDCNHWVLGRKLFSENLIFANLEDLSIDDPSDDLGIILFEDPVDAILFIESEGIEQKFDSIRFLNNSFMSDGQSEFKGELEKDIDQVVENFGLDLKVTTEKYSEVDSVVFSGDVDIQLKNSLNSENEVTLSSDSDPKSNLFSAEIRDLSRRIIDLKELIRSFD